MSGECEKCGEHTLECTCRARPAMKTAREIIAGAVAEFWADLSTPQERHPGEADAILAALAAEGFSIVETETWPAHKGAMHITHNEHKSNYQSAEEWALENDDRHYADWISDDERAKAIAEDSIWTLQWYPETPVGFCCVAASSFEALMRSTREGKTE